MSVFSDLKPRNDVGRNGFDLSRRSVFSAKCGQIVPVFCQATLPDSEYRIDIKQLLRTQPLQTAAFTGFSINYDFFFVPNNYSYSSFNEFISQRKDQRHVGQPSHQEVPRFGLKRFLELLIPCCIWDYLMAEHFNPRGFSNDFEVMHDGFYLLYSPNLPWISVSLEVLRSLDMFGYGNYLPYVKYCSNVLWDLITDNGATSINSYAQFIPALNEKADILITPGVSTFEQIIGEINLFYTTNHSDLVNFAPNAFPDTHPTLWPFLAYNKAFYEFYRSVYYDEEFRVDLTDFPSAYGSVSYTFEYVQLFNYDDYASSSSDVETELFARLLAMMCPKNHLYKKDLFTGVLPSTQFGDVSVMLDNRDWLNLYAYSAQITGRKFVMFNKEAGENESIVFSASASGAVPTVTKFRFDPGLAISVLEQRRADAMQRFKERLLRAGNKVKDVFKAHGWNEPYSASESTPIFLGTFDGRLDINTVAATMNDGSTELGQLGANGVGVVNGDRIHFKCHDFGYIVGVFYVVKDQEVDAYGLERQHCLTDPFDYPYPELQNISLFPVDNLELSVYNRIPHDGNVNPAEILGYLPRYMEYKTAVDKVHGEFFSSPIAGYDVPNPVGVFSDWVTPRSDVPTPTKVSFLYQSPNVADNVFKLQATGNQNSDQFLVNCLFDVMAVEPVTVIGLPY